MLEKIFGSRDNGFEFNNPRQKFGSGDEDDCELCRAMGVTAMTGLGLYTLTTGTTNLRAQRAMIEASKSKYKYGSRQLGIVLLAGSLFSAGIWRVFN